MEGWFGHSVAMYEANGRSPKMYRLKARIKNIKNYKDDIFLDLIVDANDREHFLTNDSDNGFWCDSVCWHRVGGYDPTKRYYERSIKINLKNALADDIFGISLGILVDNSFSPDGFMVRDMVICPDANFLYILNGYSRGDRFFGRESYVGVNRTDKVTLEALRDMARSWKVFGPCNEEPCTDVIMSRDEIARTLTDGLYTFENCYIRSVTYLGNNARRIGILVDGHTLDICQRRFKDRDSVDGFWQQSAWREFYDYASLLPRGKRWHTKEIAVDDLGFFPGYSGNMNIATFGTTNKFGITNKGPIEVQRIAIWPKKNYIKILECKQLGIDVRGTIRDDILEEVGRIEKERKGDRDRVDSLIDSARVNAKLTERIFAGTRYGVSHLDINDMWPRDLVANELKGIYSLEPPEEIKPLSYETRYLGKGFDFYSFDEWAKMRPEWPVNNPALTKAEKNLYRSDICMGPDSVATTVENVLASMNPEQTKVLYYLIGQAIDDKDKEIKKLKEEKQEENAVMRNKYTIIARDAENNRVCHSVNITRVVFNKPATIVFWSDGTKTVVKCGKGEKFDKEKGLAMAIVKKTLGNEGFYFNIISNWVKNGKDENPVSESKKDENPVSEKSAPAPKKTTRKTKKG